MSGTVAARCFCTAMRVSWLLDLLRHVCERLGCLVFLAVSLSEQLCLRGHVLGRFGFDSVYEGAPVSSRSCAG